MQQKEPKKSQVIIISDEDTESPNPEVRLICAMIERCLRDIFGTVATESKVVEEIDPYERKMWILWVVSKDKKPFSFDWCCDQLQCGERVRQELKTRIIKEL